MKARRPIKRRSDKAVARDRVLDQARRARERQAGGWCEANTPACRGGAHRGQHAHHVKLRSQGGGHEVENLRWVCWEGHDHIHANPAWAKANGLMA